MALPRVAGALLVYLKDKTVCDALALHPNDFKQKRNWLDKPKGGDERAEVREVFVDDEEIQIRVWITKVSHPEYEEQEQEVLQTVKVLVRLNFTGPTPIAEVYASYQERPKGHLHRSELAAGR